MVIDKTQTRSEQLLARATQLFSQVGYRETSVGEIAKQLGITRPLFYYYFETKEDLLWQIIGTLGDDLLARARPIVAATADPTLQLEALVRCHAETILRSARAFRIYFADRHEITGPRERRLRQGEEAYFELFTSAIRSGQAAGIFKSEAASVLAHLVTGMANSMVNWYAPEGELRLDQLVDLVTVAAVDSVRVGR